MAKRFNQIKSQNKLYFCKLCSFVATSYEELDQHYKMSHEEPDDISEEFEIQFVDKKTYRKLLYQDYLDICEGGGCVIRPRIDSADTKDEVRHLFKEYCSTCELRKILYPKLKKQGKI